MCWYCICLEMSKRSARGTTYAAQNHLHHDRFKETLITGETLRVENCLIQSSKHMIETVAINKVALRAFDDKRYIMADGITTMPYGHHSLREELFSREIVNSPNWGYEGGQSLEENNGASPMNNSFFADFIEGGEASGWETPDMGFHQRSYSENELESDIINFDELSDWSDDDQMPLEQNPFIDYEARHSSDSESNRSISLFDDIQIYDDAIDRSPLPRRELSPFQFSQVTTQENTESNDSSEDPVPPKKHRVNLLTSDSE